MTDSSLAIANLLMQGGRGTLGRRDPFEAQRKFGVAALQQGSSGAPVRSWGEGLARALQGALGGYIAGQAERNSDERANRTSAALTDLLSANTPEEFNAKLEAAKSSGIDPDVMSPIAAQLLGQKMAQMRTDALGQKAYTAAGGSLSGSPLNITITKPGVQPSVSSAPLPAPGPVNAQGAGQSADAQRAVQFLVNDPDLKFAPHQAAGFVGNLYGESGMSPTAVNPRDGRDGSNSVGLAQWNADRAQKLQQFAQAKGLDPRAFETQMQFIKSELLGSERPSYDAIRQTGSADDAAAASVGFFRPRDTQQATLDRTQFADAILRGGGQPPATSSPAPQVAQGSADASGTPQPPAGPTHDPGAMYEELGRKAADAQDWKTATAYQMEANKARAQFGTKQFEDDQKRAQDSAEHDRRQTFGNAARLRDAFEGLQPIKDYRKARAVFASAVDALGTNSAAADLNLVYAFATLMDPGSVVREGEMGMVKATQSAGDQVKALVSMVSGGQRISPEARRALVDQMASRFDAYKAAHDELATNYGAIASRSGVRPEDVVIPMPEVKYDRTAAKQTAPKAGDVLDGWRFKGGDPSKQSNWEPAQ